jgi:hypothetical protein
MGTILRNRLTRNFALLFALAMTLAYLRKPEPLYGQTCIQNCETAFSACIKKCGTNKTCISSCTSAEESCIMCCLYCG